MFVPGGLEVNINGFEDGDQVGVDDITRLQDQEQHQEEQDQD